MRSPLFVFVSFALCLFTFAFPAGLCHDAVRVRRASKPGRVRLRGALAARQSDVLEVVNRGDAQPDVAAQSFADEPLVFQNARPLGARLRGREFHTREPLYNPLLLARRLLKSALDNVVESERDHLESPFPKAARAGRRVLLYSVYVC